mmetsp:Transcript_26713/g.39684  ORF Transcript_26713/g.39684 Transcript_26713/m.39684 type:complete len:327 (-) Transcript_26713:205-1185(-)|eukprot:CAMPEP_0185040576 /NCGR_PEP_ID=MMETSP1103-20130426/38795_1 /TAXON_ID=36769 /ORGANISM="Paraphysomonas bandaiensis, Strain Caron Lab Isolate" /LENGTH=326 /DNA_ID=CAMNT_0027579937 /DNA_START=32 /DNA_END=1012 /DNA_ORIENTATION=+
MAALLLMTVLFYFVGVYAASAWTLADNCVDIYIDLGSNIGNQIRKLYEPDKFSKPIPPMVKVFKEHFGERHSSVCTFSFEPNPKHQLRLREMEAVYSSLGWRYMHFAAAVSTSNGTLALLRRKKNNFDFAAVLVKNPSLFKRDKMTESILVPVIDFVEFLKRHIIPRQLPDGRNTGKVLIKMDIEGEEYNLLPNLIASGVLCAVVDTITIEYHMRHARKFLGGKMINITQDNLTGFMHSLSLVMAISKSKCKTQLRKLDDETYQYSSLAQIPLPVYRGTPAECLSNRDACFDRDDHMYGCCLITQPGSGTTMKSHADIVFGYENVP